MIIHSDLEGAVLHVGRAAAAAEALARAGEPTQEAAQAPWAARPSPVAGAHAGAVHVHVGLALAPAAAAAVGSLPALDIRGAHRLVRLLAAVHGRVLVEAGDLDGRGVLGRGLLMASIASASAIHLREDAVMMLAVGDEEARVLEAVIVLMRVDS